MSEGWNPSGGTMKYLFILMMLFASCTTTENVATPQHEKSWDYLTIEQNIYNDSTEILMWRKELPKTPENTRWMRVSSLGNQYNLRRYDIDGKVFTTPFVCILHD